MKPVVVDAMGGDNAPSIVVEGVRAAIDAGIPVELVGDPGLVGDCDDIVLHAASEIIVRRHTRGYAPSCTVSYVSSPC